MADGEPRSNRRDFLAGTVIASLAGCVSITANSQPEDESVPSTDTKPEDESVPSTDTKPEPEPATPEATTGVGDFGDVANWTANTGSISSNESNPDPGRDSIRLSCGHDHERAMGTYRPPEPLDLTDRHPTVSFRYADGTAGSNFTIWLKAPDVENRLVYQRVPNPGNGWIETPLSTPDEVVGDPDLEDVRELTFYEYTGGGGHVDIRIGGLRLVDRPEASAVVFTFDDGHASVAETALPILEEFGYAGSVAAIPGREDRSSALSVEQLGTLRDGGWDVMSHPQEPDPLPEFTPAKQEELITESKEWLVDHGFESGARFFVYPYSQWDRTTLDLVAEHHDFAFAGTGVTTWSPPMPRLTSRIKGDDPATVESYLDRLATYGGVMPLMYHAVCADSEWISESGFRDVVTAVDERPGVSVMTVGEWYDSHRTN